MGYTLIYSQIYEFIPYLIHGAIITLQIAVLAFFGGLFFGLVLATIRTFSSGILDKITGIYVTFFTNTPQLVQIYFLFLHYLSSV